MDKASLELELQKAGLEQREAKVYLASLELGPSPVQKIAQRAGIPRATVYLILDDLKQKGFITTYDKGKKTYFLAQSPEQLETLIKQREQQLQQEKIALTSLIPILQNLAQFKTDHVSPVVQYYEGEGGFKSYMRDILRFDGKELMSIMDHDQSTPLVNQIGGVSWDTIAKKRKRQKVNRRLIVVGKNLEELKKIHKTGAAVFLEKGKFKLDADIDIIGDFVGFMPYEKPIHCVLIKDRAIANTLAEIFNLLWENFNKK